MTTYVPHAMFDTYALLSGLRSQRAAIDTERELLADRCIFVMKELHKAGNLRDLLGAVEGFQIIYGEGWSKKLKESGLPKPRQIESAILAVYNDGEGRWRGPAPLARDCPRPARGTWVVYQLLAGDDVVYIGSTGAFVDRVRVHASSKTFDSWRAAECESEAHCRALEAALIDRHRPPLNRMISTPKLALA